jgi:hypothetical protein
LTGAKVALNHVAQVTSRLLVGRLNDSGVSGKHAGPCNTHERQNFLPLQFYKTSVSAMEEAVEVDQRGLIDKVSLYHGT